MVYHRLRYRHLNRSSAHRQALLRNLCTSLLLHETITTTWHKAKEAQRMAEKLITLAKRNTPVAMTRAKAILYEPSTPNNPETAHLPPPNLPQTLFTTLRERYANRPGGYTRVLRTEPRNRNNDQAPTAVLELVDGPRDMRFAMTAKTVARERELEGGLRDVTLFNVKKVTRYRGDDGEKQLMQLADRMAVVESKSSTAAAEEQESSEGTSSSSRSSNDKRAGANGKGKQDRNMKRDVRI